MTYNKLILPAAIIIAGGMISGATIYSLRAGSPPRAENNKIAPGEERPPTAGNPEDNIEPLSDQDHILGDPNAPIVIVEFSDTECPYCKPFHKVLRRAVDEHPGQVAWVYRHFPVIQLHPKAPKEAAAAECAAELGGNDAFWAYLDRIFEITPSDNNLDLALLPEIAEYIGLDRNKFRECLDSERHYDRVAKNYNDAIKSGGRGTPYSIVITKDGAKFPIPGSLPYSSIKTFIESVLQEK